MSLSEAQKPLTENSSEVFGISGGYIDTNEVKAESWGNSLEVSGLKKRIEILEDLLRRALSSEKWVDEAKEVLYGDKKFSDGRLTQFDPSLKQFTQEDNWDIEWGC